MCRIALSFFAAVCVLSVTYATKCSPGPGYRFPITCPGLLDPTKSYCCEKSGSFRCCDEKEFAPQEESNEDAEPLASQERAGYVVHGGILATSVEDGLGAAAIIGICLVVVIPVTLICCCCCCCACCPCYHWCHPNHTTNVTVVQPSFGYPGISGQNNFNSTVPHQPGNFDQDYDSEMPGDHPPQYVRGGYSKLSTPGDHESNYIQ